MKLFQLFNSERDQLKKARTVFTAWPTNFPSVPGRTNERTSAYTVTSPVTTKSDQGRQVSFNPINFHDTLHGTLDDTNFPSSSLGIGGGGGGATPSPFSHYHRRLLERRRDKKRGRVKEREGGRRGHSVISRIC